MEIRVNDPQFAAELADALTATDCVAERTSADTLRVSLPWIGDREDERQATMELSFFVKAWSADRPGLDAVVTA